MIYCRMFKKEDYPEEILNKAKQLGDKMVNKEFNDSMYGEIIEFINFITDYYNIERYEVEFEFKKMFGGGVVFKKKNKVKFYGKPSFVTVLHEVKHCIQETICEEEARGWSCSLFYILFKDEYISYIEKGKLLFY